MRHFLSRVAGSVVSLRQSADAQPSFSDEEERAWARGRRARLNTAASAVGKVITLTTALVSIPLTLHYLGRERYGMWLTLSSLATMFAFADLGVGSGLVNAIAEANGCDDRSAIRRAASSGLATLSLIALALATAFAITYGAVPWASLFNVKSAAARSEAAPAVAIFFASFALGLPVEVVERVQIGLQMSFMAQAWRCAGSVASLVALLLAIWLKAGLPWLVLALTCVPVAAIATNGVIFFGLLAKDLRPRFSAISTSAVRRITQTGSIFLLLQIAAGVTKYSDNLIIARLLGAAAVPTYAVPERLFSQISGVALMMLWPLWPAYREATARGDHAWIRAALIGSVRKTLLLSGLASIGLVLIGPWLVAAWTGGLVRPGYGLLVGLGLWKVAECLSFALTVFFNGRDRYRLQVVATLFTALCSVLLEIFLVRKIGVAGAVWATVIVFVLFTLAPWIFYARREVADLDLGRPALSTRA